MEQTVHSEGDEMQHGSTAMRLRKRLTAVVDRLAGLISTLPVKHFDKYSSNAIFICPDYYWGDFTAEQRAIQVELKRDYDQVSELLGLLLSRAPESLIRQFRSADERFRVWLELKSNWSLSPDAKKNEAALRSDATKFETVLSVLEVTGGSQVIIVPDTNSLLTSPDPVDYRGIAGSNPLVFLLLPTVLGELDRLKNEHRNQDVREKAKRVITRIKGWRQQGALSTGVTVDKTITVKAWHREPDMKNTLSWLDADVQDDRIIASVIGLQGEQPSSRVILVTGDINLQNKADAALVETAETP